MLRAIWAPVPFPSSNREPCLFLFDYYIFLPPFFSSRLDNRKLGQMSVAWPAAGWNTGWLLGRWRRSEGPACAAIPCVSCDPWPHVLVPAQEHPTLASCPVTGYLALGWGLPFSLCLLQLSGEGGVNLSQASLSLSLTLTGRAGKGLYWTGKRRVETRVLSCLLPHCLFWVWVSKAERALICKAFRCLRWFSGRIKSVALLDRPGEKTAGG